MLGRVGIRIIPQFETVGAVVAAHQRERRVDVHGRPCRPAAGGCAIPPCRRCCATRTPNAAGLNVGRWSNAEFDALVDRIAEEGDEPQRRALIREALLIEKREIAHVPLHQQPVVWASRRNIDLAQSPDNRLRLRYVRVN